MTRSARVPAGVIPSILPSTVQESAHLMAVGNEALPGLLISDARNILHQVEFTLVLDGRDCRLIIPLWNHVTVEFRPV